MSLRMLLKTPSSPHQPAEVQHPFLLQRIQGTEAPGLWVLLQVSDLLHSEYCVWCGNGHVHEGDCIGPWMSFCSAGILQGCKLQSNCAPNLDCFHSIYIIEMSRDTRKQKLCFPIVCRQLGLLVTPRKNFCNEKNNIRAPSFLSWN